MAFFPSVRAQLPARTRPYQHLPLRGSKEAVGGFGAGGATNNDGRQLGWIWGFPLFNVGATATKSIILGTLIILTASFFIDLNVAHPFLMVFFLIMTSITFSLFGFIIGLWANNFEKLSLIPLIVITPLVFLGGSFYSISMLPDIWQKISLFNPVLYLVSGFKYSFYEISDVSIFTSISTIVVIFMILMFITLLIFKKGYNLRD